MCLSKDRDIRGLPILFSLLFFLLGNRGRERDTVGERRGRERVTVGEIGERDTVGEIGEREILSEREIL